MPQPDKLRSILEAGRVIVADFTDAIYLFVDVTPADVQTHGTVPYAMFRADQNGMNMAKLAAAIIVDLCPTGELIIPNAFAGEEEWGSDIGREDEPGAAGNTGTVDDNVNVRLLGADGHILTKD